MGNTVYISEITRTENTDIYYVRSVTGNDEFAFEIKVNRDGAIILSEDSKDEFSKRGLDYKIIRGAIRTKLNEINSI